MPLPPRPDRHTFPSLPRRPIRVVLDGVRYLPNIGTMFRLCDAFRVERLILGGFDLKTHKRKLLTAAGGTLGWVPWTSCTHAAEAVREARAEGYTIAAVELIEGSVPPERVRTDAPLCLVLGAERHGISPEVLAMADQCIEIPTEGLGGSINITTAAAIVLYTLSRAMPLPGGSPPT